MKKKNITLIAIIAIVITIVVIVVSSSKNDNTIANESGNENIEEYVQVLEDGTKVNTSEKLKETKNYEGLSFTNIKFTNNGSVTNLFAEVKNTTSKNMEKQKISINILDKEGNVLTSFIGTLGELKAGETTTLNAGIAANYSNAYNIEIVAPKEK